jgi:rod shape-determining protein MreC
MTFINKNVAIRPGDEVLTSGMGGVFPKGLLIGYVEDVYKDDSGLYQHADVVPKADLGVLAYVFVVTEASEQSRPTVAPEPAIEEEAP